VATGTVVGRATTTTGRTPGSDKTFRSFEGKFGHLLLEVVLLAFGATNDFIRFEDNGLKILLAIQTGVFINRHAILLLF
jgi:hypothetical protein